MSAEGSARTERLLSSILVELMREATHSAKAVRLHAAGLTNAEIAELLSTTPNVVKQLLYLSRSKRARTARKRPKAKGVK